MPECSGELQQEIAGQVVAGRARRPRVFPLLQRREGGRGDQGVVLGTDQPLPVEAPVAHVRTQKGAVHDLIRVHVSPVLIRDRIGVHHLFRGNRDPGGKLFRGIKVGDMGKDKGVDHQRFALGLQPGLERFPGRGHDDAHA